MKIGKEKKIHEVEHPETPDSPAALPAEPAPAEAPAEPAPAAEPPREPAPEPVREPEPEPAAP